MPHALITGTSFSGKTFLAKVKAAALKAQGWQIAVLDPMQTNWPGPDVQFDQGAPLLDFLKRLYEVRKAAIRQDPTKKFPPMAVFADEAPSAIGRNDRTFDALATQSRHWGCDVTFISQRPTMLHPTIRGQCETLAAFKLDGPAARMIGEEFCQPGLVDIVPKMGKLQFVTCTRFDSPKIGQLYFVDGQRLPKIGEIRQSN